MNSKMSSGPWEPGAQPPHSGDALVAPAVARNREPILAVLQRVLPERGTVLEIASGSGEHAIFFAGALSNLIWQPTDREPAALRSIAAHRAAAGLPNLKPPIELDAAAPVWPVDAVDAIVAINMVHIAPWQATEGLVAGAARVLAPGGVLYLYGPYRENGVHTAPSNAVFDESLRARNPAWGLRDVEEVAELARLQDFEFAERVPMPANNFSLVFRRRPG